MGGSSRVLSGVQFTNGGLVTEVDFQWSSCDARWWSLLFLKSHTPANWDRSIFLVSEPEWKLCWSSCCQLENGSHHQFILEVRSSLPLGEIMRWSYFIPDTFRVSYSLWDNSGSTVYAFGKKAFSASYWLTPHRGVLFKVLVGPETKTNKLTLSREHKISQGWSSETPLLLFQYYKSLLVLDDWILRVLCGESGHFLSLPFLK